MLEDLPHATDLNDVDAYGDVDALRWREGGRQTCHARRAKEPFGQRDSRLAHQWRKEQWQIFFHLFRRSFPAALKQRRAITRRQDGRSRPGGAPHTAIEKAEPDHL